MHSSPTATVARRAPSPTAPRRRLLTSTRALLGALLFPLALPAQDAGVRGGVPGQGVPSVAGRTFDPKDPARRIEIEGSVEIRVDADAIRVVFAVCSAGDDATAASKTSKERVQRLLASLRAAGFADASLHVDFIAMLPVYDWVNAEEADQRVAREVVAGWRVQENVHIAARDQAQLDAAKKAAQDAGVHDLLAVDYASSDIEKQRLRAIEAALAVAKGKAALLLAGFAEPPKLVNVVETTTVVPPHLLYRSFDSVYATRMERGYRDETPKVHAFRPKNTLYEGYLGDVDRPGGTLPMHPQISIVSAVRLCYESPETRSAEEDGKEKK